MTKRLDYAKASPEGFRAMLGLETHCKSSVDATLLHLVKVRASQINGCAFCIDLHWRDARASGESEHRLYGLEAWRECPWYTDRERAGLAWAESLTLISTARAPDGVFNALREHFDDKSLADLTWAIVAINGWNRVSIGFGNEPAMPRDK